MTAEIVHHRLVAMPRLPLPGDGALEATPAIQSIRGVAVAAILSAIIWTAVIALVA